MNRWGALALLLAIAGALALRLPNLDARPLHNDEAVNAFKVTELWQHGRYAYDPDEYHGPTLHYFSLPFLWLSGARDANQLPDAPLRWVTVAFGVGLILLTLFFRETLGRAAVSWAMGLLAVSPAMVFYSRYFIHEMLLVFFTALTFGAAWRYWQTRLTRWAVLAGMGLGLMWATKETFVLAVAAMVAGLGAVVLVGKRFRYAEGQPRPTTSGRAPGRHSWRDAGLALAGMLIVWLLFFTSFFQNWRGLADSILTYLPWLKRAGGHSPHINPWYFYWERLGWFQPARSPVWSEALILGLAFVGAGVSLFGRRHPLKVFLTVYSFTLAAIYCVISYKTPWCLLGFYHGLILLAGVGAAALVEKCRPGMLRIGVTLGLAALTAHLLWQSIRASYVHPYPADRRNPYVYAQTTADYRKLVQTVDGIARVSAAGYDTVVKVVMPGHDYWPLPWHLRRFGKVGWFDQLPAEPPAPVMIVAASLNARLDEQTEKKWIMAAMHELRPRVYLELYVELELWKQYVETLPRPAPEP